MLRVTSFLDGLPSIYERVGTFFAEFYSPIPPGLYLTLYPLAVLKKTLFFYDGLVNFYESPYSFSFPHMSCKLTGRRSTVINPLLSDGFFSLLNIFDYFTLGESSLDNLLPNWYSSFFTDYLIGEFIYYSSIAEFYLIF